MLVYGHQLVYLIHLAKGTGLNSPLRFPGNWNGGIPEMAYLSSFFFGLGLGNFPSSGGQGCGELWKELLRAFEAGQSTECCIMQIARDLPSL